MTIADATLRETNIGQKGFVKEDVVAYINNLNAQITSLTNKLNDSENSPVAISDLKRQITIKERELFEANKVAAIANNEVIALKEKIAILEAKATAPTPTISNEDIEEYKAEIVSLAQTIDLMDQELNQRKQEIDSLKSQLTNNQTSDNLLSKIKEKDNEIKELKEKLKATELSASDDSVYQEQIKAKDNEIDKLKASISLANQNQEMLIQNTVNTTKAEYQSQLDAKDAEIAALNTKVQTITDELTAKAIETSQYKDSEIQQLNTTNTELTERIAFLESQVSNITTENDYLKKRLEEPTMTSIGTLFASAQSTILKLNEDAERNAEKLISDARKEATMIVANAYSETAELEEILSRAREIFHSGFTGIETDISLAQTVIQEARELITEYDKEYGIINEKYTNPNYEPEIKEHFIKQNIAEPKITETKEVPHPQYFASKPAEPNPLGTTLFNNKKLPSTIEKLIRQESPSSVMDDVPLVDPNKIAIDDNLLASQPFKATKDIYAKKQQETPPSMDNMKPKNSRTPAPSNDTWNMNELLESPVHKPFQAKQTEIKEPVSSPIEESRPNPYARVFNSYMSKLLDEVRNMYEDE